jgi:hypothetical protein
LELVGAERQQLSNTSEDNHVDSNAQDLFLNAQWSRKEKSFQQIVYGMLLGIVSNTHLPTDMFQ